MRYIDENELEEILIIKRVVHLDKYDMVYIKLKLKDNTKKVVRVFCDKDTFPEFDSDEFKENEKLWPGYSKNLSKFLVGQLFGNGGLMNEQGRDDYIYLGGWFQKYWKDDRYEYDEVQGKTKQQIFDENLFRIKMQVAAKEQSVEEKKHPNENQEGKNYAIADIHGMYGSYIETMKRMKPSDHLYIIGDAIDRGSEGIKILQDIIHRQKDEQNNPKITFLLGNHEMQFWDAILTMRSMGLRSEEILKLIDRDDKKIDCLKKWINANKGKKTYIDYLKLQPNQQKDIIHLLQNSYVALPQSINGENFLFVHAMPPRDEKLLRYMKSNKKGITLFDLRTGLISESEYRFMLQERYTYTYEQAKSLGFTTICGHTPNIGHIIDNRDLGYICIDAGCGHKRVGLGEIWKNDKPEKARGSSLALYCIDDRTVEYIDEKETSQDLEETQNF